MKKKNHKSLPPKGLIGRFADTGPFMPMSSNVTQQDFQDMLDDVFGNNELLRPDGLSGDKKI